MRSIGPFLIILLALALIALRFVFMPARLPAAFTPLIGKGVTLTGTVVTLPDERETQDRLTLLIAEKDETTRIIASVPQYPKIHVGDVVHVQGKLEFPKPFETDGGRTFSYPNFLRKDGVFALMQPAYAKRIRTSKNPWLRFLRILEWMKDRFMHLLEEALPEPESALAAGIIVGGKQGLGDRLIDDFTKAGMLQLVVLSGANVMIVADAILKLLSRLPKKIAFLAASTSIMMFVFIAGAGTAALRAGVMATIAMYARVAGKQYSVFRALAATVVALSIWNPLMLLYDPGFQFSLVATIGLILGTPIIEPRLLFLRNAVLIEAFSTSLAAEAALLPFLLWQTGNLSMVSVFANVATGPIIPFCMAASSLAAAVAPLLGWMSNALPLIAGIPAYLGLGYVITIATVSASFPFATVIIPAFSFWMVVGVYLLLGGAVWRYYQKHPHGRADVS